MLRSSLYFCFNRLKTTESIVYLIISTVTNDNYYYPLKLNIFNPILVTNNYYRFCIYICVIIIYIKAIAKTNNIYISALSAGYVL